MISAKSSLIGNALLLFVAAIWGTSFGLQAAAMKSIGPFWFTGLRFFIGALVIIPFALRETDLRKLTIKEIALCLPVGAALFFAIVLQQISLKFTTVSNAGFLTALYVIFTPLISWGVFSASISRRTWIAAVAACVGGALVAGSVGTLKLGDALVVLSCVAWALQIILLEKVLASFPRPVTISVIQFLLVSVLGCLGGVAFENINFDAVNVAGPYIIFCSVVSVGFGYTLQTVGQKYTTANAAAIILSSEAVFAAIYGNLVLGEQLTTLGMIGAFLVMSSVVAVQVQPRKEKSRSP